MNWGEAGEGGDRRRGDRKRKKGKLLKQPVHKSLDSYIHTVIHTCLLASKAVETARVIHVSRRDWPSGWPVRVARLRWDGARELLFFCRGRVLALPPTVPAGLAAGQEGEGHLSTEIQSFCVILFVLFCLLPTVSSSLPTGGRRGGGRSEGLPVLAGGRGGLQHITLYYTILYYTILYYTILYYNILYYTILYYTILYYTIIYYDIL